MEYHIKVEVYYYGVKNPITIILEVGQSIEEASEKTIERVKMIEIIEVI